MKITKNASDITDCPTSSEPVRNDNDWKRKHTKILRNYEWHRNVAFTFVTSFLTWLILWRMRETEVLAQRITKRMLIRSEMGKFGIMIAFLFSVIFKTAIKWNLKIIFKSKINDERCVNLWKVIACKSLIQFKLRVSTKCSLLNFEYRSLQTPHTCLIYARFLDF